MAYIGLAVRVKDGKPHLRGVVLDDPTTGAVETFDYLPPTGASATDMIHHVANGLAGKLASLTTPVERVVVRQADDGQRGGMTAERVLRARAEGAAVYAARQHCADVRILNGPGIGRACGGNLADAEDQAKPLAGAVWKVAASAALAAQQL